ncbi:hypothetical protein [Peribacillus butanolivorans]
MFISFSPLGHIIIEDQTDDMLVIVLSGEPIDEPNEQQGRNHGSL